MLESQFNYFYQKYHRDLFNFLSYMVKDKVQAEDLTQEVYIRVLKSYGKFEGRSSEKTWLFSIARNVAIDFFRKQKCRREQFTDPFLASFHNLQDGRQLPEEIAMGKLEMQEIYICLERCTIEQRMVIIYRYFQCLSIAETADILGWSESKVKTVQHRTIKKLTKEMQKAGKKSVVFNSLGLQG